MSDAAGLNIRDTKSYENGFYLIVETIPKKEEPYLFTSEIKMEGNHLKHIGNVLTYEISKEADEKLYKDVLHLEECAEKLIRNLDDDIIETLPEVQRKLIKLRRSDPNWVPIRANYYSDGEFEEKPTMFLKGSVFTTIVKDMDDNFLFAKDLKAGYYQFKLRACMVYIGTHKRSYQVANVQLRIVELLYSPVPFDAADTQVQLTPHNSPSKSIELKECPVVPKKRKSTAKKPATLKRQNVNDEDIFL